MKQTLTAIIFLLSIGAFAQNPDRVFAWDKGDSGLGFWNKSINCGRASQPGGANNTRGSKVTFGVNKYQRFEGAKSVEYWTNSQYQETCNQNFTAERAEMSAGGSYRSLGVKEGSTVWVGWSELWDEVDETHSATVMQFRSNCGSGSPASEIYMRPGRVLQVRTLGGRTNIFSHDLDTWYDFVVEIKYSKSSDGYFKIHYKKYNEETYKTVTQRGATMRSSDGCPHMRWGVYRWASGDKKPNQIPEKDWLMIKYVSTVRMKVGSGNNFNTVRPDQGGTNQPPVDPPTPDPEPEPAPGTEPPALDTPAVYIGLDNLARSGAIAQSSVYGDGLATIAIDGITYGDNPWNPGANISHTNSDSPSWLRLIVGADSIAGIVIHNRKDRFSNRITGAILTLNDNLVDTLDSDYVQVFDLGYKSSNPVDTIMIQVENFLHVSEVQVWGTPNFVDPNPPSPIDSCFDVVVDYISGYRDSTWTEPVLKIVNTYLEQEDGSRTMLPFRIFTTDTYIKQIAIVEEKTIRVCKD